MRELFLKSKRWVKYLLLPLVLLGVSLHFYSLLRSYPPRWDEFQARPVYLLSSASCYLLAHTLWGTFFWQLLHDQGTGLSWFAAIRAYFVSQVGKYLPGKAWVILLRMMMLRSGNVSATTVAVCGVFETLTSMAAGAMLAALLLPYTGLLAGQQQTNPLFQQWLLVSVGFLPLGAWLLNRLIVRIARRYQGPDAKPFPKPSPLRLLQGLAQAFAGWILLGVAAWLALQGLSARAIPDSFNDWLGVLGANAVAYISGFVLLFLPGGLGAREEILQRMLTAQLKPTFADQALPLAIMTAIVLRTLWTVSEVFICMILYQLGKQKPDLQERHTTTTTTTPSDQTNLRTEPKNA